MGKQISCTAVRKKLKKMFLHAQLVLSCLCTFVFMRRGVKRERGEKERDKRE